MTDIIPTIIQWVGGKKKIMPHLLPIIPPKYNNYYEPFLGGGALLRTLQPEKPKKIYCGDINSILMKLYQIIRDNPKKLLKELDILQKKYIHFEKINEDDRLSFMKDFYLDIRTKYNDTTNSDIKRITYFLFLNKSCFNAVYRENSKGGFNVPFNNKSKIQKFYDKENILKLHDYLKKNDIILQCANYKEIISTAKKGDFIYFDPPYYPMSKGGLTNYHKSKFGEKEQLELFKTFVELDKKKCYVLLSNSAAEFIQNLYKSYNITFLSTNICLNRNKNKRKNAYKEVLIRNYL